MVPKKISFVLLIIIVIGTNSTIQSQNSVHELWNKPLGELWLSVFIDERDRDLDSSIDTIVVHHSSMKANEDMDKEIFYTWSINVYRSNQSNQQLDSFDNWVLIKNNTQLVTLDSDTSSRGFTDFITVNFVSSVKLFLLFNISNTDSNQFSWEIENLYAFNETMRELNIEKNGGVEPIEYQFIPPSPWNREQEDIFSILEIPTIIWWITGINILIAGSVFLIKQWRSYKNDNNNLNK